MKKVYSPPMMTVVEYQQESHILAGSVQSVTTDVGIDYGGGGNGDAMSPELDDHLGVTF